jgi:hypothetical protein
MLVLTLLLSSPSPSSLHTRIITQKQLHPTVYHNGRLWPCIEKGNAQRPDISWLSASHGAQWCHITLPSGPAVQTFCPQYTDNVGALKALYALYAHYAHTTRHQQRGGAGRIRLRGTTVGEKLEVHCIVRRHKTTAMSLIWLWRTTVTALTVAHHCHCIGCGAPKFILITLSLV